jgi:hypothetical protein
MITEPGHDLGPRPVRAGTCELSQFLISPGYHHPGALTQSGPGAQRRVLGHDYQSYR